MMSIVLFAIIGATMKAGLGYWICFYFYCIFRVIEFIANLYTIHKKYKED